MWKLSSQKDAERSTFHKKKPATSPTRFKHGARKAKVKATTEARSPSSLSDEAVFVAETNLGIEVSFDMSPTNDSNDGNGHSKRTLQTDQQVKLPPLINLTQQLRKRNRVHRSQFSVNFPLLQRTRTESEQHQLRRCHRVPLLETGETDQYDDMLFLLRSYKVSGEEQAVLDELARVATEMEMLEEDRMDLEKRYMRLPPSPEDAQRKGMAPEWDVNYWLGGREDTTTTLTAEERETLQHMRGVCLTMNLHNAPTREAFVSVCDSRTNKQTKYSVLTPSSCKPGGAAETVGHMALMSGKGGTGSFFLSRDDRKSLSFGNIPRRLYRLMRKQGLEIQRDLVYLATGPRGSYYAEFRTGQCMWGSALGKDMDFSNIVRDWDVYRVVFGPMVSHSLGNGRRLWTNSWIILGRDGRAAWKNLPARLHSKLECRLADWAAPAEIALGSDDSYFVRFLDGSIDYCLPAAVANVCEHIESHGGRITDMKLHPEVSQDFIIRHTELNKR